MVSNTIDVVPIIFVIVSWLHPEAVGGGGKRMYDQNKALKLESSSFVWGDTLLLTSVVESTWRMGMATSFQTQKIIEVHRRSKYILWPWTHSEEVYLLAIGWTGCKTFVLDIK